MQAHLGRMMRPGIHEEGAFGPCGLNGCKPEPTHREGEAGPYRLGMQLFTICKPFGSPYM